MPWVIRCTDIMGYGRYLATSSTPVTTFTSSEAGDDPVIRKDFWCWDWAPTARCALYSSEEAARVGLGVYEIDRPDDNMERWIEWCEDGAWEAAVRFNKTDTKEIP